MPIGHPDSADVRRHFFGRTIYTVTDVLGANGVFGHTIPETDIDDIAIVRVLCDAGVSAFVQSIATSLEVTETWQLLTIDDGFSGWGHARKLVVQPQGGGIGLVAGDTTGVAGKSYTFQVDTYIGADQNQMRINHESQDLHAVIPAGNATLRLVFPSAQQYDRFDVIWQSTQVNGSARMFVWHNGATNTSPVHQFVPGLGTPAAGTPQLATVQSVGAGVAFDVINLSGAIATIDLAVRAYKQS